jgi:hypothetical protein
MKIQLLPFALAFGLLVGCEESPTNKAPATPATQPAAATVQKPPPPPPPVPPPEVVKPAAPQTAAAGGAKVPETPPPGMTAEKADVGSGAKGRGYGEGVIATPVATYFAARERIMFSITIPDYIRAYEFEHDFKAPKSNEEFMEKIIKKNGIQLPTLPPGHRYWYDAAKKELQVLKPN